jgi:hypothetical protein
MSQDERSKLLGRTSFDPQKHDVFQISVAVEFELPGLVTEPKRKLPRKMKRKSYDRADRICIQSRPGAPEIEFLGILPVSQSADGQAVEVEFSPEVGFGWSGVKISLVGRIKALLMRRKHVLMTGRTENFAQWIFLKPWIDSAHSIDLEILCMIPKSLATEDRFLRIDAVALDGSRVLEAARGRRVAVPLVGGPSGKVSAALSGGLMKVAEGSA